MSIPAGPTPTGPVDRHRSAGKSENWEIREWPNRPPFPRPAARLDAVSVPFISDWHDLRPFSDVPAHAGVSDVAHMLEGWTRTRQRAAQGRRLEAQVGDWNTVPASLLELLARYRRAVARIVIPGGQVDYRNLRVDSGWTGTGFLVAPNLLLTNHHVLNSVAVAGGGSSRIRL